MNPVARERIAVVSPDGARSTLQFHEPAQPRRALYWLPALGVGIAPNETFADAIAERDAVVAVHEWRGLGSSDRRASRRCDWGYATLLDDVSAGLAQARERHPGLSWALGGHSLGGQFALIHAACDAGPVDGVFLVASGHPWWRAFPGWNAMGVLAFAAAIPPITRLVGHFPGSRLGFAGREASRLMREWAGTCRRGDYRIAGFGDDVDRALANCTLSVRAIRMELDRLAPPRAIEHLRRLSPNAAWHISDVGRDRMQRRRPDHFGWLREPDAVVDDFVEWGSSLREGRSNGRAPPPAATP